MCEPSASPLNVRVYSQECLRFSLKGLFNEEYPPLNLKINDMGRKRSASFDSESCSSDYNSHKVKKENDGNEDNDWNKNVDNNSDNDKNIAANVNKNEIENKDYDRKAIDENKDEDGNKDTSANKENKDADLNKDNNEKEPLWDVLKYSYSNNNNVKKHKLHNSLTYSHTFDYDDSDNYEQKSLIEPFSYSENNNNQKKNISNNDTFLTFDYFGIEYNVNGIKHCSCIPCYYNNQNYTKEEQKSFGLRDMYICTNSVPFGVGEENSEQILIDTDSENFPSSNNDFLMYENEATRKKLLETEYEDGFIDTHCHIDFLFSKEKFKDSFNDYMKSCEETDPFPKSFKGCIAVFCDPLSFRKVDWWEAILNSEFIWGVFGCHPHFSNNFGREEEQFLEYALKSKKVKAVGEIGLDFSGRNGNSKELQEKVFRRQLDIAKINNKPVVIHSRDAYPLCLSILKEVVPKDFVIHRHCFTGDFKEASAWLDHFPNCFIGFTCLITQDSARGRRLRPVVEKIPIGRLLLETDAPYFKPKILESDGINSHPGMAIYVANEVAKIKGMTIENVLKTVRENTRAVYAI